MAKERQKVVCALSGGIDSSVAAALLKKSGFNVMGIFMKLWSETEAKSLRRAGNKSRFPAPLDRAKRVAKSLKIPFYVLDVEKEFKKKVVAYFLNGYKAGVTPNPCVVCNKEIKFGILMEKALSLGADFIATGHYARIRKIANSEQIRYSLISAKDKNKDQSYFLWMLTQKQLRRILFPIGDYNRSDVKRLAKEFKLDFLLDVPKSTEICFIQNGINNFLRSYLKPKRGFIVNLSSGRRPKREIIGRHEGLAFYTIGQRKGIGLSGGPYYVKDLDLDKNILIVTKNKNALYKKGLIAKNINWISGKEPKLPLKIKARIRYRHRLVPAEINKYSAPKTYQIIFEKPQQAVTPGQSVVFYSSSANFGNEVLGGGVIIDSLT